MSESGSDRPVVVTAEERLHPALRKLARACLALARHLSALTATPELPEDHRAGSDKEDKQ